MKPDPRFRGVPHAFWAYVRSVSEDLGYTGSLRQIAVHSRHQVDLSLKRLHLKADALWGERGDPHLMGGLLLAYFQFRADILNREVQPRLMVVKGAVPDIFRKKREEDQRRVAASSTENARKKALAKVDKWTRVIERVECDERDRHDVRDVHGQFVDGAMPVTRNKQTGTKSAPAYFTDLIAAIISQHAQRTKFDRDPRQLTTFTRDQRPLRTLARRVDGAFPSIVNPVAIWEIKEYYYTTSFGSRVADGVYESLLDGMELAELRASEGIDAKHYLLVDAHYTWWGMGKSYLCRIIDMLHMGYVDEAIFGYEVVERLPILVDEWVELAAKRATASASG